MRLFGDKSATLSYLASRLVAATVPEQATFTVADWHDSSANVVAQILSYQWAAAYLIVRSSVSAEDVAGQSLAGHFSSVQNVRGPEQLRSAIEVVLRSYRGFNGDREHILVQPMLQNVTMSGVATSREIGSGRPYIVINYSMTGDTTAVTAGHTNDLECYYHFRDADLLPPGRLGAVICLLLEIEAKTEWAAVDVEFAFCADSNVPVLLQARPLHDAARLSRDSSAHRAGLKRAEEKAAAFLAQHPLCYGQTSVLGTMPDWNPAEMLGVRPRPLALSLYRDLVTDSVWAHQRWDYGYRDLRGFPLMIDLLGIPYIDVRASFNSFVPCQVSNDFAERLVNHYIDRLIADPSLHDKIEFEIVFSCYTFDLGQRLGVLRDHGFSRQESDSFLVALRDLTRRIVDPRSSPCEHDRAGIATLCQRRALLAKSNMSPADRCYWLLDDCRRYGTRPFAGLARAGFIAVQSLNTLVTLGMLSAESRRSFLMGLNTVGAQLRQDFEALDRQGLLERYGHLRPGTYDILSPRYDDAPDFYFGLPSPHAHKRPPSAGQDELQPGRSVAAAEMHVIGQALAQHGFDVSAERYLAFLGSAIRDREHAKFEFSRNLSDALAALSEWGEQLGLSTDELSFADIGIIRQCHCTANDPKPLLSAAIERGRYLHEMTMQTVLPPLLTDAHQVWGFHMPVASPTFITNKSSTAPVATDLDNERIDGCIVLLPNADPGFDWIFSRNIAGLVTAYGGVNSHMAIRASELDLPAVIGSGERLFSRWMSAAVLRLDCANRRVEIIPSVQVHEAHRRYAAR
jgi:phosphohistidine swiveling domain-containing protein